MRAQAAAVVVVCFPHRLRGAVRLGALDRFRDRHQIGEREHLDAHLGRLVFDEQGVEVVAFVALPAVRGDVQDLLDAALLQCRRAGCAGQVAVVELRTLVDVLRQPLAVQQQQAGGAFRERFALFLRHFGEGQQGGQGVMAAYHAMRVRPVVEGRHEIHAAGHAGAESHRLRPRQVGDEKGFRGVGDLAQKVLLQRLAAPEGLLDARAHDRAHLRAQGFLPQGLHEGRHEERLPGGLARLPGGNQPGRVGIDLPIAGAGRVALHRLAREHQTAVLGANVPAVLLLQGEGVAVQFFFPAAAAHAEQGGEGDHALAKGAAIDRLPPVRHAYGLLHTMSPCLRPGIPAPSPPSHPSPPATAARKTRRCARQ